MANENTRKLMVFSGRSNPALGDAIAKHLGVRLGGVELGHFSNGEIYVHYTESVRGADVFVIQTLNDPINDNLVELLIMIDALKRASAARISAVVPHYGYARQDKKTVAREPISAKLVADLLTVAGINRLVTMDLHAGQIQGFFDVPVDHLTAVPLLAGHFKRKRLTDLAVVSPDVGRVKMAKRYSDLLGASLAILHKIRPAHNVAETTHVIGEVKGKTALIVDDMIDTGGTIVGGAQTLLSRGVTEVYVCATHGILSGPAMKRLTDAPIEEIVLTDTVPVPEEKILPNVRIVSIAGLFARAIRNVHEDRSVSRLFRGENQ